MDRIERSAADEAGKTCPVPGRRGCSLREDGTCPVISCPAPLPTCFTREDVEKAAAEVFKITWKRECYNGVTLRDIDRYRKDGPDSMGGRVERYETESIEIATAALAAINALDSQLVEAVGLLREIEAQFRFYGDNHAAKPDPVKAKTNYDWADRISAFLAKQGDA